ncbi:hypothetical protein PIECOFPK_00818 [Mycovorax composti]|jgi:hypothetical protein|uniref:Uncharacterized protein n=1 Tax=Mycovorax composti TaxID=2962693 RepID=A0ABZ2EI18_9BACT
MVIVTPVYRDGSFLLQLIRAEIKKYFVDLNHRSIFATHDYQHHHKEAYKDETRSSRKAVIFVYVYKRN